MYDRNSVESFEGMKAAIPRLRKRLGADPDYFRRVYIYTFDFGRAEGQRSLPVEIALAFWGLLLPLGLKGGALRRQSVDCGGSGACDDSIMKVDGGGGWTEEHSQLWYTFLGEKKNIKGISKDTWAMVGCRFFSFFLPLCPHAMRTDRLKSSVYVTCVCVCVCARARALLVPCVLAHDGCNVRDVRHGRYVPILLDPARALRPFAFLPCLLIVTKPTPLSAL